MSLVVQSSATFRFRPQAEAVDELRGRLEAATVPFERLPNVHFARLVLIPALRDARSGRTSPAWLLMLTDFDGPPEVHLGAIAERLREALDPLLELCEGYVAGDVARFLAQSRVSDATDYVNTMGQTVERIRREDALRRALRANIDANPDRLKGSREEARRALRAFADDQGLLKGLEPVERYPTPLHRVGAVLLILVLLTFLPILLFGVVMALVVIRRKETTDPSADARPGFDHVRTLAAAEDRTPINPFSAYGFVKPGLLRLATVKVALFASQLVLRRFQANGTLFGVKTIHFARWTFVSDATLFFASNYDGSLESYMDDFIDRIWWGLNGVFGNGVDYPPTRWLLFGGARDEARFKNFIRIHQLPTQVWYSAYPHLTCSDIVVNAKVCRGLFGEGGLDWLRSI